MPCDWETNTEAQAGRYEQIHAPDNDAERYPDYDRADDTVPARPRDLGPWSAAVEAACAEAREVVRVR